MAARMTLLEYAMESACESTGTRRERPRLVYLVVNPISGRRRSRRVVAAFRERVEESLERVEVVETRGAGDARETAARAGSAGADVIIVAGGDGTVREAAEGAVESGVPILIAPCGTENVLAKHLGIHLDEDALWDVLQTGRSAAVDVAACGGRSFIFAAGVGFDAEVIRRLTLARRGHISYLAYARPLAGALMSYRSPVIRLEIDGARAYEGRGQLVIANISRYALGMQIVPGAVMSDGLLDVCVVEYRSRLGLIWQALKVLSGTHGRSRGIHVWRGRQIRVETEGLAPVELDGDIAGTTPIEIAMTGRQARFLVSQTAGCPN